MVRLRTLAPATAGALALLTPVTFGLGAVLGGEPQTWLANASFTSAAAFAVIALALGCSRIPERARRRPWRFLLVALGAWLLGQLLWDAYFVFGTVPSSPSAADALWLACALLAIFALIRAAPGSDVTRWVGLLDALALAVAGGSLGIAAFYAEAQRSTLGRAGVAVALGYSVLYLGVVASLVPALFRRATVRRQPELALVVAGVLFQAAGFVLWTPLYLDGTYRVGAEVTDPLWLLGLLAIGAAGLLAPRGAPIPAPSERSLQVRGLLSAVAAVGLVAAAIYANVAGHPHAEVVALELSLLVVLVLLAVRTWLLLGEQSSAASRERALARQNRLLLDAAGEGIVAVDLEGRIALVNPAAAGMLGWSAGELMGRDAHEVMHHSQADGSPYAREACPVHAARGDALVQRDTEVFWRRDGSFFAVEYTATPIVEGGRVVGSVTVFSDISERKALEAQLRQAQKMEAVGQLAGGIAHDFNNLLTAMSGYTEFALERAGHDVALHDDLSSVQRAAGRAAALTQQLLAFGRRQLLQPTVADPNESIHELQLLLARVLGEQIEVVTRLDPAAARIRVDVGQLQQVLVNLALNARDAMPGGGRLTLATANVERPDGSYVAISVHDTGCGMDEETRASIFEPFFTTKEAGKGTGLGLSTAYGIVTQSGGRIDVRSAPGEGSEFTILLPRTEEAAPVAEPGAGRRPDRGSETVLLVEDDEVVRRLVSDVLGRSGYGVIEVGHPEEALAVAAELREDGRAVDLLVTDVVMPSLSGPELARSLSEAQPDVKVLYMSGYAQSRLDGARIESRERFLAKPFSLAAFTETVRDLLDATA